MLLSIASLHRVVAFVAEEVCELESEDTDLGGKKQKKTEVLCVSWNCLLVSYANN